MAGNYRLVNMKGMLAGPKRLEINGHQDSMRGLREHRDTHFLPLFIVPPEAIPFDHEAGKSFKTPTLPGC